MSTEHKAYAMLIKTDAGQNNNKFYEIILDHNDMVHTRWGRVGSKGQSATSSGGQYEFDRIKREKTSPSKKYKETQISGKIVSTETVDKETLKKRATADLLGDSASNPVMVNLVNHLTEVNRHQLSQASSGNITIDDSGMVMTPLGMVTTQTVKKARSLLLDLNRDVNGNLNDRKSYVARLENYLTLIPQKIPTRRGWDEDFFTGFTTFEAQNSLLDQLEGSVDLYEKKKQEALNNAAANKGDLPRMFETQISLVTDPDVIKRIQKMFVDGSSKNHVSAKLKLKRVFELKNDTFQKRFDECAKKVGNVQTYWHGTRAFNVLSILRGGLIIPKSSGGNYHISGRMFGDGVYFSDNSTKSLNYSYGYWGGGGYDNNCFMFVADVAMGKVHKAKSYTENLPRAGYDSTFAEGGVAGVANNEMIVYSLDQVNLRYLCEFE